MFDLKKKYEHYKEQRSLSESSYAYQQRLKSIKAEKKRLKLKSQYQKEKAAVDKLKKKTRGQNPINKWLDGGSKKKRRKDDFFGW